jgi:hypothetical protein
LPAQAGGKGDLMLQKGYLPAYLATIPGLPSKPRQPLNKGKEIMNERLLSLATIRRLRARIAKRRFALGVATGASLLGIFMAWGEPAAHSDVTVAEVIKGGQAIDTLVVTDHLYLHGPGGTLFEISVGKDASGNATLTAKPGG